MAGRRVYLLDVSFFTFRAYHALPPLTTSGGVPTNAVHGVAQMLERLFRTEKPEYVAACFDSPGPGFRGELYESYKANRAEPDRELQEQFPFVKRLIEAMGIPCIEVEGYEADDVIATLAKRLADDGDEVVIVTGDKDLMQCVSDRVTLYDPIRNLRIGPTEVVEKFGVPPEGVVEVQGLMGDSTDNIPGVPGVGPKTATALIEHFGTIENVLGRADEIESLPIRGAKRIRAKVVEHAEQARVSRELARVRTDVPVELDPEALRFHTPHTRELLTLAEELEMGRLAERIRKLLGTGDASAPGAEQDDREGQATAVQAHAGPSAESRWQDLLPAEEVAFVWAAEAARGALLALAAGERRAIVAGDEAIGEAVRGLAEAGASLSGYDVKAICRSFGVRPGARTLDVGVASYLYDPSIGGHGYGAVVERFLGEAPAAIVAEPRALMAALSQVERLIPRLRQALVEHEQTELYRTIELPLIGVLADIEARGILLDVEFLRSMSAEFQQRMETLVRRIHEEAGCEFNILSPVQLREVLFERLKLPLKGVKQTKTGPSTDSDTLMALASEHPLPALVLEYRGLAKLKSTYLDALPRLVDEHGRIHTRLNQTVTATGRLSSSEPNLQNIPIRTEEGAKIRRAFIAPPDSVLVSADYNQIELRVLAHLSRDEALLEAFRKGQDIHRATASEVFEVALDEVTPAMRRAAKVINFGIIYGMGPGRLSRELGISRQKAQDYIERYFRRYGGVRRFYDEMLEHARRYGYVATLLGRRRYLPEIHDEHGGRRQLAERVATNTPIQGSAADIIKLAMVRLADRLRDEGSSAAMVLQIHDELLLECPKSEIDRVLAITRDAMENAVSLAVPTVVDIGTGASWAEAH